MVLLDLLSHIQVSMQLTLELAWLVDSRTVRILHESTFSSSPDGLKWVSCVTPLFSSRHTDL